MQIGKKGFSLPIAIVALLMIMLCLSTIAFINSNNNTVKIDHQINATQKALDLHNYSKSAVPIPDSAKARGF